MAGCDFINRSILVS